jgi:hypothetical protein
VPHLQDAVPERMGRGARLPALQGHLDVALDGPRLSAGRKSIRLSECDAAPYRGRCRLRRRLAYAI